jgi:hypothetical protein
MKYCCIFSYLAVSMKRPSLILRLSAFLLLAVFSQKMAGGLLIHNLLHTQTSKTSHPDDKNKDISYACSCVDDFLMPFDEVTEPQFIAQSSSLISQYSFFTSEVYRYRTFHFSRRGPPSINC